MKKSLYIVLLMLLAAIPAMEAQQYKYDVGPMLGMTGYLGEGNNGNLFKHPSFTVGGLFRYNHIMPTSAATACMTRHGTPMAPIINSIPV